MMRVRSNFLPIKGSTITGKKHVYNNFSYFFLSLSDISRLLQNFHGIYETCPIRPCILSLLPIFHYYYPNLLKVGLDPHKGPFTAISLE